MTWQGAERTCDVSSTWHLSLQIAIQRFEYVCPAVL